MNIQAFAAKGCGVDLWDAEEAELYELWKEMASLLNDVERLWVAMPQCPQNYGDSPGDPDWVPPEPPSSS